MASTSTRMLLLGAVQLFEPVNGMEAPFWGAVLGIALTLLLGGACAASSNALALTTKSEDTMAPIINTVITPVLLLSGILLPMTLAPEWLQKVSDLLPTKHVVDAVRSSFLGDVTVSALGWGIAWTFVLLAVSLWWGTATFRRENA